MRARRCVAAWVIIVCGLLGASGVAAQVPPSLPTVTLPPLDASARVKIVSVCPGQPGTANPDQFAFLGATQELLLPTLAAVQTYAKPQLGPSQGTRAIAQDPANPSPEFGNLGMGGPWDRRVVFIEVAGSAADLQRHADALNKVVPRPDRLVVCPTALSEARRNQIQNELYARFLPGGTWVEPLFYGTEGFTEKNGRVAVQLRSDAIALAEELTARYGSDIVVFLGNSSWPDPRTPGPGPDLARRCGTVPTASTRAVAWSIPVKSITVRSGASFALKIRLRNVSAQTIRYTAMKVVITRPGSRQVIANRGQIVAYAAVESLLFPGTPDDLTLLGGTDACDASRGWTLPPGRYEARIVPAYRERGLEDLVSAPISITVTR